MASSEKWPDRGSVFPAYLRTGVAPQKLRHGGPDGLATFFQGDDEVSLWRVTSEPELVETLAALMGANPAYNRRVRFALVPEAVLADTAAGVLTHSPEHAHPGEPPQVAERHYDLTEPNHSHVLACFLPGADPSGWAGPMKTSVYGAVWRKWIDEDTVPPSYSEKLRSHAQRAGV